MRFALNHIAAPNLSLPDFFAAARDLGVTEVEIRNDLIDCHIDVCSVEVGIFLWHCRRESARY